MSRYLGYTFIGNRPVTAEDIVDFGIGTEAQQAEAAEWLRIEAELRRAAWLALPFYVRVWRSRPRFYESRRRISLAIAALRGQVDN